MTVETVRDGLRNLTLLNRRHIEEMAKVNGAVVIDEKAVNEPTAEPNGTSITLSMSIDPLEAAQIAEMREKVSMEMLMWMKGARVMVSGEAVEAESVQFDEAREEISDCGRFKIQMYYLDRGHSDELRSNFIHAGPVFIARENFGKEGHRLGHKLHCVVSANDDWYHEHFEGRRELFVSEARDLKLKLSHPEAQKLKAFAERHVAAYLKDLDAREKEREQKTLDERKRKLMENMSRQFSQLMNKLDFAKLPKDTARKNENPVPREKSENTRERKSRIQFDLREFQNDKSDYRINEENGIIEINLRSPQLSLILEDKSDVTWEQAVLEIVRTAFVDMETKRRMREHVGDRMMGFEEFSRLLADTGRDLRIAVNEMMTPVYQGFQMRRNVSAA